MTKARLKGLPSRHRSLDVALKFSGEIGRRPDGAIDASHFHDAS
jgi:hypothetical protein